MGSAPAWPGDFPDPHVVRDGHDYWAFGTNGGGTNVRVLHSTDLRSWEQRPDALPRLPGWARPGCTWAPSVLARPGHWVLYVTVREPRSGRQAVMVGVGPSPQGPYEGVGDGPLVFQADLGGSIDPSPFVDADGTAWLLWKADANAVGRRSTLWAQRLTPDGLDLAGSPTELLAFDAGWERPLIEAPAMARDGDRYYLFYSGGWWASDGYGIGYAVADAPAGPWRKITDRRPWLGSDDVVRGPGGQEIFVDGDGQPWMAYHGWEPGRVTYRAGGRRTFRLTRLSFVDGRPVAETSGAPPPDDGPGPPARRGLLRRLLGT